MTHGTILLAATLVLAPGLALATAGPSTEETVWSLESDYFTSLYRAEYDRVLALGHPRFLGWPDGKPKPLDHEGSAAFMRKIVAGPTPCRIEIERQGIEVQGSVALTQYVLRARCTGSDGKETTRSSRICHTWVKAGAGAEWKLLGGMSRDL